MLARFELASEGGATATFTHLTTPAKFLTGKDAHQRVWTLLKKQRVFVATSASHALGQVFPSAAKRVLPWNYWTTSYRLGCYSMEYFSSHASTTRMVFGETGVFPAACSSPRSQVPSSPRTIESVARSGENTR